VSVALSSTTWITNSSGIILFVVMAMADKIAITELRLYGDFPREMGNTWMEHWHPSLVASEVKL
jgi:hypothetical protein